MEDTPTPAQNLNPTPAPVQSEPAPRRTSPRRNAVIAFVIFLIVIAVISVLVFRHVSKQSKASTPAASVSLSKQVANVTVSADSFSPQAVTVSPGTTVKWTVTDSTATHMIASDPYPADNILSTLKSKQLGNGATYSYTFNNAGTYTYHDNLHPTVTGTVIVK
jgi:plastocyanin